MEGRSGTGRLTPEPCDCGNDREQQDECAGGRRPAPRFPRPAGRLPGRRARLYARDAGRCRAGHAGFQYRHVEYITAARDGLDDALALIGERSADVADASRQRLVRNNHVRPDRSNDLVLRDQPAGIFHEIAEHFEALGAQLDRVLPVAQRAARHVERVAREPERPVHGGIHRNPPASRPSRKFRSISAFFQPSRMVFSRRPALRRVKLRRPSRPPCCAAGRAPACRGGLPCAGRYGSQQ